MGVLEFAFDAAGQRGLAVAQGRYERDDHVRLVDELKVANVNLPVDIGDDPEDFLDVHRHGLIGRACLHGAVAYAGCFDRVEAQGLFVFEVSWVETDHVAFELATEFVDLRPHIGQVHHVAHREAQVGLLHVRAKQQPNHGFSEIVVAAHADIEAAMPTDNAAEQFGRESLLFPPHHNVLQRHVIVAIAKQPAVNAINAIEKDNIDIRVELDHLIVVERKKEPMAPAERRVGVDEDVRIAFRLREDVLEDTASQIIKPGYGQIEDLARGDIGGLFVHPLADMKRRQGEALLTGQFCDAIEERFFVEAYLSGNDDFHREILAGGNGWGSSVPRTPSGGNSRLGFLRFWRFFGRFVARFGVVRFQQEIPHEVIGGRGDVALILEPLNAEQA